MKYYKSILTTVLLLLFAVTASAQMAQSDYEIQKQFKQQYNEYQEKLETISTSDSAQALIESVREFDTKYKEHSDLLNKVLHPETYNQKIQELKKSSVMAMNRLETIEKQNQKMESLQKQLTSYESDLQRLNSRTDSLQNAMQKSIESEKQLSDMVRQYRNSLEQRDELILAFIDSMVVAYQQMDLKATQNLENMDNRSELDSDSDALEMIHQITSENLNILENNAGNLHLEDYMRMSEVQQQFENMWTRLGDKIREVYDGEQTEKLASEINQNISEWGQTLKDQTFAILSDSLSQQGINVGSFSTGEELYGSLNTYLDAKISESNEGATDANYQDFKGFKSFWNKAEIQWSSNFVDADILTTNQMATLNDKVDTWGEQAQPQKTNNILVYLLGATVLLAVALGVMLIREKKNK